MRRLRWLILVAIILLSAAVGYVFYSQRKVLKSGAMAPPAPLASGLNASLADWSYTQMDGECPVVSVAARNFAQTTDNSTITLEGVSLKIFHDCGQKFDKVNSARATFDKNAGTLFSEGEVEITMGVPTEGEEQKKGRLLSIKSSGVRFDIKSGKAETDKFATFSFDHGEGQAVGAVYDPSTREVTLKNDPRLTWHSAAKNKDMKVEAGWLLYKERDSLVLLSPWARLTRGNLKLETNSAVVHLNEGVIRDVEAQNARGTDSYPNRQVEYAAQELRMEFDEDGVARKIVGLRDAKLISTAAAARTTVTSDRIDLEMANNDGESVLQKALTVGHSVAESKPTPQPKAQTPDTRVLKAEVIEMLMRPGGKEIDRINTHTPGQIEFLPNRPGQSRRQMDAERMTIQYASDNQIQSYRAANVSTRTYRQPQTKGAPATVALTWSKDLLAEFEPKTSQMQKLEQWQDFRYQEGDRKASADHATMLSASNKITLQGRARVWDPTGSTAADSIDIDQNTSDFIAEGNVTSTRQPEKKQGKQASTSMLSGDDPMQAKARKMYSKEEQSIIYYEGNAVLWQGGNRLTADYVVIDRDNQTLAAKGNVFNQLVDQGKKDKSKPAAGPIYTVVRAPEMIYSDEQKLAIYKGGATLVRPNLDVKSREIRAWLKEESDGGTSLDHAFAIGAADIFQRSPGRTRHSTGERAEYYVVDERVVMEGSNPKLEDSVKGYTVATRKLTWFSNDDRLIVDGAEKQPVKSVIRRKTN